jgi:dihydrofolate synthase / folylpolyglutamate synthase
MTYKSSLSVLDGLVNYEKLAKPRDEFKLDNIRRLFELAGDPQKRLHNVILVAGTKGKGSTCYMLDAALRGCGLSTGLFVSPHVLDVRERIQLNGSPISKRQFADLVTRLAPFVSVPNSAVRRSPVTGRRSSVPVSYFEMMTAMAFLLFAEKQPDYSIIEVGLGGRLDATNLCDPIVSVITRIGYDHLKVLGNTLRKIAGEKAGIMRQGRAVVISDQEPEALRELQERADAVGAGLVRSASVAEIPSAVPVRSGLSLSPVAIFGAALIDLPLLGRHQVENCQTALAVLNELSSNDRRIKFNRVARGMGTVSIPARCQVVRRIPLTIVDSCHNPESGRALADVLRDHLPVLRSAPRRSPKVVLVYGSLGGKLVARTVAPLKPWVETAVLVKPNSPRAMPLPELKRVFTRLGVPYVTADSVRSALVKARQLAQAQAQASALQPADCKPQTLFPIVVAGSFYLAGEALKVLGPSRAACGNRPSR